MKCKKWEPIFQSVPDVLDTPKNSFQSKAEEILEDSIEGQRLRFLENEIHKTNLKLMEGRLTTSLGLHKGLP